MKRSKPTLLIAALFSLAPLAPAAPAQPAPLAAPDEDRAAVQAAAAHLHVVNAHAAYGNLSLPATLGGVAIDWRSSNDQLVTGGGEVTRPAGRDGRAILRATLRRGAATAQRAIAVRVPKAPVRAANEAYLFVHFSFFDEKIYFSLSKGNSALDWQALNKGTPVFASTLGMRGLRDPYIVRSPQGDTFYLMATDLKWFGGAQGPDRKRYIEVWESHDLVHWSAQRDVLVSPPAVQNTYAPEAVWDASIGAYVVFWTSKIGTDDYFTPMYATTRDFVTFTEARIWQADEWRIDSTVAKVDGWYHRFTKSIDKAHANCHDIVHERAQDVRAPRAQWETVETCLGARNGVPETEAPLAFKSNPGDIHGDYHYLWMERWTPTKTYVALRSKRLDQPQWEVVPVNFPTPLPKHGAILPISAAEAARLRAAYPPAGSPGKPR